MSLSNTLCLLLSLFLLMMLANKVHSHTTTFQIDSFKQTSGVLTYERDAFVPSHSRYLRLVATDESGKPRKSSVGRVLYSSPVKFWEHGKQASFETTINLRVKSVNDNPADGMTFFIVPVNSTLPEGGSGGNLGIFDAIASDTPIFAVEFDTYVNHPDDPNFRHIGIDINSKVSKNITEFEKATGQIVTARICYDAPTRNISVVATYGSKNSTVSYVYDLKTVLPQCVQVGISASTGPQVAIFDVFSWYFTSTMVEDNQNIVQEKAHIKILDKSASQVHPGAPYTRSAF